MFVVRPSRVIASAMLIIGSFALVGCSESTPANEISSAPSRQAAVGNSGGIKNSRICVSNASNMTLTVDWTVKKEGSRGVVKPGGQNCATGYTTDEYDVQGSMAFQNSAQEIEIWSVQATNPALGTPFLRVTRTVDGKLQGFGKGLSEGEQSVINDADTVITGRRNGDSPDNKEFLVTVG